MRKYLLFTTLLMLITIGSNAIAQVEESRSFGFLFTRGWGLSNNNTGIVAPDGKEVKLSFGGGYGFGLYAGRVFSEHFEITSDLIYQKSSLSTNLTNASMDFKRYIVSLTPSYIWTIREYHRMKLGIGIDYYTGNLLVINASSISGGFDDTWMYTTQLGLHARVVYEAYINSFLKYNVGLKYYSVNHTFNSSGVAYPTSSNPLKTPDGSGIDLFLRLAYYFERKYY